MKRFVVSLLGILILTAASLAQQPKENETVVKISTNLIQVDVTVTDKNGKIVTGLKPEDFEIRENGEIQKISNLIFISKTSGAVNASDKSARPNANQNPSATTLAPGQVGRTIAIV